MRLQSSRVCEKGTIARSASCCSLTKRKLSLLRGQTRRAVRSNASSVKRLFLGLWRSPFIVRHVVRSGIPQIPTLMGTLSAASRGVHCSHSCRQAQANRVHSHSDRAHKRRERQSAKTSLRFASAARDADSGDFAGWRRSLVRRLRVQNGRAVRHGEHWVCCCPSRIERPGVLLRANKADRRRL